MLEVSSNLQIPSKVLVLKNVSLILGIPNLHPANPDAEFATRRPCAPIINTLPPKKKKKKKKKKIGR